MLSYFPPKKWGGVGVMVFQQYFSYVVAVSFIGGGNRSSQRKPLTNLSQVTDIFFLLYHIMLYQIGLPGFELVMLMVIGTDYIGSCQSNYHTIMPTCQVSWWLLYNIKWAFLYPRSTGRGVYCFTFVRPSQDIFRRIFLSNYWWQKSDIWSQASYRYAILWEAFLDPSFQLCHGESKLHFKIDDAVVRLVGFLWC